MRKYELTPDALDGARTYIKTRDKDAWVLDAAPNVFRRMDVGGTGGPPVPPMYAIDVGLEERYLMTFLISRYFCMDYEAALEDQNLMTAEEFDRWAAGNPLGRLKRMRRGGLFSSTAGDLLDDFKSLRDRFYASASGLLKILNDPVGRQNEFMSAQVMSELPELLRWAKQEGSATDDATA